MSSWHRGRLFLNRKSAEEYERKQKEKKKAREQTNTVQVTLK